MRRLPDKSLSEGRRQVVFEHEWRADFTGEALTLELDADEILQVVEFYSARFGVVRWAAGKGLGTARRWETEDEAQNAGMVKNHYAATFLDGCADTHATAIVNEVMKHFSGAPMSQRLRTALAQPELPHGLGETWLPSHTTAAATAKNRPIRHIGRAVLDLMRPYTACSRGKSAQGEKS